MRFAKADDNHEMGRGDARDKGNQEPTCDASAPTARQPIPCVSGALQETILLYTRIARCQQRVGIGETGQFCRMMWEWSGQRRN